MHHQRPLTPLGSWLGQSVKAAEALIGLSGLGVTNDQARGIVKLHDNLEE